MEKVCVGVLGGPDPWTRELGPQEGSQDPSNNGLAPVTSDHFPPLSPSTLASTYREQHPSAEAERDSHCR